MKIIKFLFYIFILQQASVGLANDIELKKEAVLKSEQITKVVYHLNDREKSRMLIESVNELLNSSSEVDIQIVIHGIAIIRLAKKDVMSKDFSDLISRGVTIGACSNSILRRRVDPNTMVDGVELVTEGGIKRILTLQQQGYLYIKI